MKPPPKKLQNNKGMSLEKSGQDDTSAFPGNIGHDLQNQFQPSIDINQPIKIEPQDQTNFEVNPLLIYSIYFLL